MRVYLVGAGPGSPEMLTGRAARAIRECELLIGAARLIEPFSDMPCEKRALVKASDIACALRESDVDSAVVLFSGDAGFYSGASLLRPLLSGYDVEELPGISSLQYLCAHVGTSWQDVHFASAHGRSCNVAALVRQHGRVALLTGGAVRAHDLCAQLVEAGMGTVRVWAGERLSYSDERVVEGTAEELAGQEFLDLTVLLVDGTGDYSGVDEAVSTSQSPTSLLPRVLVASTGSGVGKTSFTCGLLRALQRRGLTPLACKCGPDYIDPLFHRSALGVPSRNLDLYLMGEAGVRNQLADRGEGFDLVVVEGAMGYYDGIGATDEASAWDVARVTDIPVVLLVDARGKARSVAAEVLGFLRLRAQHNLAGVVLNRASASYYPQLKAMVEEEADLPVLGYLPVLEDVGFASRHLGLVPADELPDVQARIDKLADAVEDHVNLEALIALAGRPLHGEAGEHPSSSNSAQIQQCALIREGERPEASRASGDLPGAAPVIAVARDEAFCFYYDATLRQLEALGAQLIEFSPLHDAALPEGACGLYLGGGYPELHAAQLAVNTSMLECVSAAIDAGLPTVAECGGFLYLHETLEGADGAAYALVGAVPGHAYQTSRLSRFGYVELESGRDGLLAPVGARLRAHEFHYWDSDAPGDSFIARKPRSTRSWPCAHVTPSLYAGFPHLCLAGAPEAAERFVEACRAWGGNRGGAS